VNKAAEAEATRIMIDRVEGRFDLWPGWLVGDSIHGSAGLVGWLIDEKQIELHVPVVDKSEQDDGAFFRSDFQWDETTNEFGVLRARHCVATGIH
jgi:hypothetical protein